MIRKLWYFFLFHLMKRRHFKLAERYMVCYEKAYPDPIWEYYFKLEEFHTRVGLSYAHKAEELFNEQAQEAPRAG